MGEYTIVAGPSATDEANRTVAAGEQSAGRGRSCGSRKHLEEISWSSENSECRSAIFRR
jgi:hypothetical protein